jgi:hypothetical protein
MFAPKRPSKEAAVAELKHNLTLFGAALFAIRAAPYLLHFLQSKSS